MRPEGLESQPSVPQTGNALVLQQAFQITRAMQDAHDFDPVIQGKIENQVFFNGKKSQGRMEGFARGTDFRVLSQKMAFFLLSCL